MRVTFPHGFVVTATIPVVWITIYSNFWYEPSDEKLYRWVGNKFKTIIIIFKKCKQLKLYFKNLAALRSLSLTCNFFICEWTLIIIELGPIKVFQNDKALICFEHLTCTLIKRQSSSPEMTSPVEEEIWGLPSPAEGPPAPPHAPPTLLTVLWTWVLLL